MGAAPTLESDLEDVVAQWLDWLPRWNPGSVVRRAPACLSCPSWSTALGLDDPPHGVLHALVTSVDAVIAEHFRRAVALRFPEIDAAAAWSPAGRAGFVASLADIRDRTTMVLLSHRPSIEVALGGVVEQKVRTMADLLVAEVCGV